jgi:hypothetical protein
MPKGPTSGCRLKFGENGWQVRNGSLSAKRDYGGCLYAGNYFTIQVLGVLFLSHGVLGSARLRSPACGF